MTCYKNKNLTWQATNDFGDVQLSNLRANDSLEMIRMSNWKNTWEKSEKQIFKSFKNKNRLFPEFNPFKNCFCSSTDSDDIINAPRLWEVLPEDNTNNYLIMNEEVVIATATQLSQEEDKKKKKRAAMWWALIFSPFNPNRATKQVYKTHGRQLLKNKNIQKNKTIHICNVVIITFLVTLCATPAMQKKHLFASQQPNLDHSRLLQDIHNARQNLKELTEEIQQQKVEWDETLKTSSIEEWAKSGTKNRHLKPLVSKIFNDKVNEITPADWKFISDDIDEVFDNGASYIQEKMNKKLQQVESTGKDNPVFKPIIKDLKKAVSDINTQIKTLTNESKTKISKRISQIKPRKILENSADPAGDIDVINAEIEAEIKKIVYEEEHILLKKIESSVSSSRDNMLNQAGIGEWKKNPDLRGIMEKYPEIFFTPWTDPEVPLPLSEPTKEDITGQLDEITQTIKDSVWKKMKEQTFYKWCNGHGGFWGTLAHVSTLGACSGFTGGVNLAAATSGYGIDSDGLWNIFNASVLVVSVVGLPGSLIRGGVMIGRLTAIGTRAAAGTAARGLGRVGLGSALKVGTKIASTTGKVATKISTTIAKPFKASRSLLSNIIAKDNARKLGSQGISSWAETSQMEAVKFNVWVDKINSAKSVLELRGALRGGVDFGNVSRSAPKVLPS